MELTPTPELLLARNHLKMRAGAELDSEEAGTLHADTKVRIIERRQLEDGTARALVALEGADAALGWISCVGRDGRENLRPLASEEELETMAGQIKSMLSSVHKTLGEFFHEMDEDENGSIDRAEFRKAMGQTGVEGGRADFDALFDKWDANSDGVLSFDELERALKHAKAQQAAHRSAARIQRAARRRSISTQLFASFVQAARNCALSEHLTQAEHNFLFRSAKTMQVEEGQLMYAEGEPSTFFYFVHSGTFIITSQKKGAAAARSGSSAQPAAQTVELRSVGPMENFGGSDLIASEFMPLGRTSTVTATSAGMVWAVPRRVFDLKLRVPPPPSDAGLLTFVDSVRLFSCVPREQLVQLCRAAVQVQLQPREVLCREGDAARAVYTVRQGFLQTSQEDSDYTLTIRPPDSLGESALGADDETRIRGATVSAGGAGATVLVWSVASIEALIGFELQASSSSLSNRKVLQSVRFGSVALSGGLSKDEMDVLVEGMEERTYTGKGTVVLAEGEKDQVCILIKSGTAVARSSKADGVLCTLTRGEAVGEASLLLPAQASKQIKRKVCICLDSKRPLVALVLRPDVIHSNKRVQAWSVQLSQQLAAESHAGFDAVVHQKMLAAGLSPAAFTGSSKRHRTSAKSKAKGAAPAAAPAPAPAKEKVAKAKGKGKEGAGKPSGLRRLSVGLMRRLSGAGVAAGAEVAAASAAAEVEGAETPIW